MRFAPGASWVMAMALIGVLVAPDAAPAQADRPAAGAPGDETPSQEVTVVAPVTRAVRFARALNFIQSHGAPARTGQLARWRDAVCPMAAGLSPSANAFVAARVETLVKRVGAPRRGSGRCTPNVEILFTSEPQALMDAIARRRPELLGFHYRAQRTQFATVSHPIEARYLTATQGRNREALDIADGGASMSGGSIAAVTGPMDLMDVGAMPGGCAGSRFTHCLSSLFSNIVIVADTRAIGGRPIGAVADYIAMLALAQAASQDACAATPSLFDLLAEHCGERPPPATWTESDVAYLAALYRTGLSTEIWIEKADIAEKMLKPAPPERDESGK